MHSKPLHAMDMSVQLCILVAVPLEKDQLIQMHRRIGGPQGWSEYSGETNIACADNLSQIAQSVSMYPDHYID